MRTCTLLATAVSAALLTVASTAWADTTLCVHMAGESCPAGSTAEGSDLQTALGDAGADGQPTTIDVLAGAYPGPFLSFSSEPLVVAGAGVGRTILTGGSTVFQAGCSGSCSAGTFAVHDLSLQLTTPGSTALTLFGPFDAHDIAVTSSTTTPNATGVVLSGTSTLEHATITLPQTGAGTTALHVAGVGTASDLTLAADIGVAVDSAANLTLSRVVIDADTDGIDSHGPGTVVDDALIRLAGDSTEGATSVASGVTSSLSLLNSTILAAGANDVGVHLQSEGALTGNHRATATVTNTILWGEQLPDYCVTGAGGPPPALTLSYDDIDPAGTPINCVPTTGHLFAVNPGFVSPTDAHPRFDSPLIDQGDPTVITPPGTTDLDGNPRLVDGDGNGNASRDLGAYEYQRRPPIAGASAASSATVGQPVTFDASGSFDPDPGETLTYGWDFGDGATASTAVAAHAFVTTGPHTATVSVTDPTGQTATAHVTVMIPGPPGSGAGTPGGGTPGGGTPASSTPGGGTPGSRTPSHPAAPKLTLAVGSATIQRLMHGLKVTVTLSGSGRVTLRLRDGRRTLATRRIAFSRAGRRVVLLRPSKRLAKTLRHATRLKATLTATIAGASAAAVSRHLVLRR